MVTQIEINNVNTFKKVLTYKCIRDAAFKDKFVKNPKETIEQEFGMNLPDDIEIQILEDSATKLYFVLPPKNQIASGAAQEELSDDELQAISGAGTRWSYTPECLGGGPGGNTLIEKIDDTTGKTISSQTLRGNIQPPPL